jgi:multicomponent Na+:H+ antiporter subunit A
LLVGGDVLESAVVVLELGPLGDPKVTSPLAFDAGVFLVVVGMVLMLFEAFGESVVDDPTGAPGEEGAR